MNYNTYTSRRKIGTDLVQHAVNRHFKTRIGWPLYPVDKIETAMRAMSYIHADENLIEFDNAGEFMVVGKLSKSVNITREIKDKLIKWLAK